MNTTTKTIIGILVAAILAGLFIVWVVYFNTPALSPDTTSSQFGSSETRNSTDVPSDTQSNEQLPVTQSGVSTQKIFKVTDGPVAGATLIESTRPTSTIARFIMQTNGHTFDLTLDSAGAVPKAVSNTTIPGIARVMWSEEGRGALLQYIDENAVKTAHITLPSPASTTPPVRIQFLPTGIVSLAVSPDGKSSAYLMKTNSGSDLYTASANGGSAKKITSFPLSQLLLSWPAQGVLLAQTPAAQDVTGVAFSVDAKSGAAAPLLYAAGLSATADRSFSKVIYQTASNALATYVHTVKTGLAKPLSFSPVPELCVWSLTNAAEVYCVAALSYVGGGYADQLHLGTASPSNSIVKFNTDSGISEIIATPGGADGGQEASIVSLAVSQGGKYLLFTRRGDRSLWAVRLSEN